MSSEKNKLSTTKELGTVALLFRRLREIHNVSRPKLAKGAGVSEDTIKRIEDGRVKDPRFSTIISVLHYFGYQIVFGMGIKPDKITDYDLKEEPDELDETI